MQLLANGVNVYMTWIVRHARKNDGGRMLSSVHDDESGLLAAGALPTGRYYA
jgi:hypothetical protein